VDKSVIFAVAGSGKTQKIIDQLNEEKRFLIVTYTETNRDNLRERILGRFRYFPANISLYTYFTFLHAFCYLPFLLNVKRTKGMSFVRPDPKINFALTDDRRFMTSGRWLYHNRVASLVQETGTVAGIKVRIEKYFDAFLVDEVQDFAGHDFNLFIALCRANVQIMFGWGFF